GELATRRADELRAAAALLTPGEEPVLLGLPDGALAEHAGDLASRLREVVGDEPAQLVTTWRGDGHGDHRAVGEAVAALAAERGWPLLEFPIWLWHWGAPDDPQVPWDRMRSLSIDDETRRIKRAAIEAHASQLQPLSDAVGDEAPLRADFVDHFLGDREIFIVPEQSDDRLAPYFERLYARSEDPWGYRSRWYERRKRAVTLSALPRQRFGRAIELGSSIGELTAQLADRCDELIAVDASAAAVELARQRLGDSPGVRVELRDLRDGLPAGEFDLVVLSELGYYLDDDVLDRVLDEIAAQLAPDGVVLLCHWRHPAVHFRRSGDEVHAIARRRLGMETVVQHLERDFRLDVLSPASTSVAQAEGLT
ncbi:MAG TPA: methyltransferase domain-containing protein, partial [Pseudolysinimonas sp.]|nr:methyltransferase domain-containing protein [Pseudolysinimonas sp.]